LCSNIDAFIREKARCESGWARFVGLPVVDVSFAALDSLANDTYVAYIERRVSKRTAENTEQRTVVGVGADCPKSIDTTCPLELSCSNFP
jgi:hypothetical protein